MSFMLSLSVRDFQFSFLVQPLPSSLRASVAILSFTFLRDGPG